MHIPDIISDNVAENPLQIELRTQSSNQSQLFKVAHVTELSQSRVELA